MAGKVVLVGAGPGDPSLLTIRGREYIEHADAIIYDRLASSELLAYAKESAELIYVGKENHHHTMKQEDINQLLVDEAKKYKLVVRLKGGDPYVFGRGGEEALVLKENGIEVEIVPGISSVIATLTDAGIPITHRGKSKGFQVVTAHSKKDQAADINYSEMLDPTVTYLFLMGLAHVKDITEGLMAAGRDKTTPAAVISNGTTARQRKVLGTLENLNDLVVEAGLESPAIIVVGEVVNLSNDLAFFESRRLFGKSYVVPYIEGFTFSYDKGVSVSRKQEHFDSDLEKNLRELGADVRALKVGRISPVEIDKQEFKKSLESDWILFTSQNGVNAFLWNLKEAGLDIRALGKAKIAVVGGKTKSAIAKACITADLVPGKQTGKGLAETLMEKIEESSVSANSSETADDEALSLIVEAKQTKITLFGAKESNPDLAEKLADYDYQKLVVYENVEEYGQTLGAVRSDQLEEEVDYESFDGIFFTSGSCAKRFAKISAGKLPKEIYSIGPKCSEVIEKVIAKPYHEAEKSSYEGLLKLV